MLLAELILQPPPFEVPLAELVLLVCSLALLFFAVVSGFITLLVNLLIRILRIGISLIKGDNIETAKK